LHRCLCNILTEALGIPITQLNNIIITLTTAVCIMSIINTIIRYYKNYNQWWYLKIYQVKEAYRYLPYDERRAGLLGTLPWLVINTLGNKFFFILINFLFQAQIRNAIILLLFHMDTNSYDSFAWYYRFSNTYTIIYVLIIVNCFYSQWLA